MTAQETELRDRFAECALHALISGLTQNRRLPEDINLLPGTAYELAEAMLEARKRQP